MSVGDNSGGGRPAPKTRAGIMPRACPEKKKLVDALLRGESPVCNPKRPEYKRYRDRPSLKDLNEDDYE